MNKLAGRQKINQHFDNQIIVKAFLGTNGKSSKGVQPSKMLIIVFLDLGFGLFVRHDTFKDDSLDSIDD